MSQQKAESRPAEEPYDALVFGLNDPDREALYRRIDLRVDRMLEQGILDEARQVWLNRGAWKTAAQAIGYKEFFPYFEGEAELERCTDDLKQASRRYAKRQLTWFRHMPQVQWLDISQPDVVGTAEKLVQEFLRRGAL